MGYYKDGGRIYVLEYYDKEKEKRVAIEIENYDAFGKGGYEVEYCQYGGAYNDHITTRRVTIGYASKAWALRGIKNFKDGYWLEIKEYPGKCKPGRIITLAELEEPENKEE